jgi:UDP-glucose 4-epimerase
MDNKKNIVVIGSTGFVGEALLLSLKKEFNSLAIAGLSSSNCNLLKPEQIKEQSKNWNSQTVLILCSAIKRQNGDDLDLFQKNIGMVVNLSEEIKANPVKKIIFLSSAAVYGEDVENLNISEETKVTPTSYYGISKYSCEILLQKALSTLTTELVILRPPTIYGPSETGCSYGPTGFLRKALGKKEFVLWGDGSELREFVFIDDISNIVNSLIDSDFTGVLNTVSGISYSFKQVIELVESLTKVKLEIINKERSKDKVDNKFNSKLVHNLMGNYSFQSLESGMSKIYAIESGRI